MNKKIMLAILSKYILKDIFKMIMVTAMVSGFFLTLAMFSTGCATSRTRHTDPIMRVTVDADSLPREAYVRLQKDLFKSRRFIVVDRAAGFRAIAKEQEIEHTTTRFGANEKYALWSKMYGVGGIFVGTEQCKLVKGMFHHPYAECVQTLTLMNATTGEVMAVGEATEDSDGPIEPSWKNAVAEVIDTYPSTMIDKHDPNLTIKYDSALVEYRDNAVMQNQKPSMTMNHEDYLINNSRPRF